MARSLPWKIYYHRMWGQLSTTCSNVLMQPNGELLVAVNHNQLRTIASETVDPTDWYCLMGSTPERHVHSINQCNLGGTRTCNTKCNSNLINVTIIIIFHHFLPPPRRGSHVKPDNTHTLIKIHPLTHILYTRDIFSSCPLF